MSELCSARSLDSNGTDTTATRPLTNERPQQGIAGGLVLPTPLPSKGAVLVDVKEVACEVLRQLIEMVAR